MAQKDVGNKIPIYKLKTTDEVMKYYDEWGIKNKYDQDMIDWNYTGPKETVATFTKYAKDKNIKILDAGCGTGLVGVELKKYNYLNIDGMDLSKKLLDLIPKGYYQKLDQVDLNKHKEFVEGVTSQQSNETVSLCNQLQSLEQTGVNMALLLTGSIGIASEGGEFSEIVKKCIFQGKPLDADTQFHIKRELGDIMWYWINSCRALGLDPNDVIEENVNKLKSRYPGGEFDVHYSENRREGDI